MKLAGILKEKGLNTFDGEPRHHAGIEVPRVWCLVADHEKAYVFRKTAEGLQRIATASAQHDAGGGPHHGYDPHSQHHHHANTSFVRHLAEWLEGAATADVFDRLVLVAAPKALGELRDVLGWASVAKITREVPKDLTRLPDNEIEAHLEKLAGI